MKKNNLVIPKTENNFQNKWGQTLLSEGWFLIPSSLVKGQQYLNISATELNILLILISFWWDKEKLPFPSKRKIANIIGCDTSTVRKNIKSLEDKDLISREYRKTEIENNSDKKSYYNRSNIYHLDGLIEKLTNLALTQKYIPEAPNNEIDI